MNFIVADPEGENFEFARNVYDNIRKRTKNFRLNEVTIKRFRDGEIKPKIQKNVRKGDCFFIHDSNKRPADWFLELCLTNYALKFSSAEKIVDVMPYLDFSRQDRKDQSRVPISAKVVAKAVSMYANSALTIDLHNLAIVGFYDIPLDDLYSFPVVVAHLRKHHRKILENLVVLGPDIGSLKRAKQYAKALGVGIAVCDKDRPKEGEVGDMELLGDVAGKNVLVVDDMIDSGGTLAKAGQEARNQGARNVYASATFGLFTEGTEKVTPYFDKVFVGDIIKQKPDEKIEVISFTNLFAEAIYRTSRGRSLSELFI